MQMDLIYLNISNNGHNTIIVSSLLFLLDNAMSLYVHEHARPNTLSSSLLSSLCFSHVDIAVNVIVENLLNSS